MVEKSTQPIDAQGTPEPLAALEQVQRELDELAQAMNQCQSDIDAAARQPEELARQKAELFDRLQQEHQESQARRRELEALEAQLRAKQASLERMAKQIESRKSAMEKSASPLTDGSVESTMRVTPGSRAAGRAGRSTVVRLIVDLVVLVMVLTGGAGYWWIQHQHAQMEREISQIRGAMRDIHNQALLHASQGDVPVQASGYPMTIDKSWFSSLPVNGLAQTGHPWLQVAEPEQYMLVNPQRIVVSADCAGFWYNPARGIVRARVPMQMTDSATVALYNQINATSVTLNDVTWGNADR